MTLENLLVIVKIRFADELLQRGMRRLQGFLHGGATPDEISAQGGRGQERAWETAAPGKMRRTCLTPMTGL